MTDNILLEMIKYFKNDCKRINHALKVYSFANIICIAEKITGIKKEIIDIAAILHDIGILEAEKKYLN